MSYRVFALDIVALLLNQPERLPNSKLASLCVISDVALVDKCNHASVVLCIRTSDRPSTSLGEVILDHSTLNWGHHV